MNILKQITSIITDSTDEESPIHKAAAQIAQIVAQESTREAAVKAIAELALDIRDQDKGSKERAPESDERSYAFHLCHTLIGLCRYGESKVAFMEQWAIDAIEEIVQEKVQQVATNQGSGSDHERFYTEDLSEQNWSNMHHLIDLDKRNGKNYLKLDIHQMGSGDKSTGVTLEHNEVDELLAVLLRQRLEEAEKRYKESEARNINAPAGDDFDPFLDSDELP